MDVDSAVARVARPVMKDAETEKRLSFWFLRRNGADQAATDAFLQCTPEVQFKIRTHGNFGQRANSSRMLMGRIRDIQRERVAAAAKRKAEEDAAGQQLSQKAQEGTELPKQAEVKVAARGGSQESR
jgi:hypothetical protein